MAYLDEAADEIGKLVDFEGKNCVEFASVREAFDSAIELAKERIYLFFYQVRKAQEYGAAYAGIADFRDDLKKRWLGFVVDLDKAILYEKVVVTPYLDTVVCHHRSMRVCSATTSSRFCSRSLIQIFPACNSSSPMMHA